MEKLANRTYTVNEYLDMVEELDFKIEYSGGKIFSMAGAGANHSIIANNARRLLTEALDERDCVVFDSDMQLAANIGLDGIRVGADGGVPWPEIAEQLLCRPRVARVRRRTRETDIRVDVALDRPEPLRIDSGIGFFDHMLEQFAKHGGFALELSCKGDLEIDEHHTVEDCALALGQALREALGDKHGIGRYGFVLPMDEAQAQVAVDLAGRPYLQFSGKFDRESVGGLPTELVSHFFRSLSDAMAAAIHISVSGDNSHHMIEAVFKGIGRAMRPALAQSGIGLPSTKGAL